MKTQISRQSHDPKKRYSGVYQQQGRMITDADWNELVEVLKARLDLALQDAVGSGTPRGRALGLTAGGEPGDVAIVPGIVYVDGIRAQMPGDGNLAFSAQRDFPGAPAPEPSSLVYADVWERAVVSLEDSELLDPGLHGADTTSRTRSMVQVKWCNADLDPSDASVNPPLGTALVDLSLPGDAGEAEAEDPCLTEAADAARIGNYLFRVEVHDVARETGDAVTLTLKWSSENAAEQHGLLFRDSHGAEQHGKDALPPDFTAGPWTYELYSDTTEMHLGHHLAPGFTPLRGLLREDLDTLPDLNGAPAPYVRRWDGSCRLRLSRSAGSWVPEAASIEGRDKGQTLSTGGSGHGLVELSQAEGAVFHLQRLVLTLSLDDHAFVAGDYWLAVVREGAAHFPEEGEKGIDERVTALNAGLPLGVRHHYLVLGGTDNDGALQAPPTGSVLERRCDFPPLTDLTADRVGYAPQVQQGRWQDIQNQPDTPLPMTIQQAIDTLVAGLDAGDLPLELGASLPPLLDVPAVTTVQDALTILAQRIAGSGCAITVGAGGQFATLTEAFEGLAETQNLNLCLLPGTHATAEELAPPAKRSIRLTGAGAAGTLLQLGGNIALRADELSLSELGVQASARDQTVSLEGYRVGVSGCAFADVPLMDNYLWDRTFGGTSHEYGLSLAVDGSGNLFVTGYFTGTVDFGGGERSNAGGYDLFVLKLDSEGGYLWDRTFGSINHDVGNSLAVDGSGNLLITGYFAETVNFGGGDRPSAGGLDLFVLKLDGDGGYLWDRTFGGTSAEYGKGLAMDGDGNVLVTGNFSRTVDFGGGERTSANGSVDLFVLKLDGDSGYLWDRTFGGTSSEYSNGLAVDGDGNLVVIGSFNAPVDFGGGERASVGGSRDFVILKLDGDGSYLWDRTFGGTSTDLGMSLAADGAGNLLITGSFSGSVDFGGGTRTGAGGSAFFVLKLDGDGGYLWDRTFDGEGIDVGRSLVVDAAGNLLITGGFYEMVDFGGGKRTSAGNEDLFVLGLDGNGGYLWDRIFEGQGDEYGRSLAVDGAGNILITGHFVGTVDFGGGERSSAGGGYDLFVLKLGGLPMAGALVRVEPPSQTRWLRIFGGTNSYLNSDQGWSLTMGGSGNVLVTGVFRGTTDFGGGQRTNAGGSDLFVLKLDNDGAYLWDRTFGGTSHEYAYSLAVDGAGNVLVTGFFSGRVDFGGGQRTSAGSQDVFVLKLDGDGAYLWDRTFGDTSYDRGLGLAVDAAGNVLVTGFFCETVDFGGGQRTSAGEYDLFVLKLDSEGGYLWDRVFGDTSYDRGASLAVDGAGNPLITGLFSGTVDFGGGERTGGLFVLKLDSDGGYLWDLTFVGTSVVSGWSLAVDGAGSLLVTGNFSGTVDFGGGERTGSTDIFVLKLDSDGGYLWDRTFGGTDYDRGCGLAFDGKENVLVTGYFRETVDFGGGERTSAGDYDIFVLKLDSDGGYLWDRTFGSMSEDIGRGLAVDGAGNVLVTGPFGGTVDFGEGPVTALGAADVFVLKLAPDQQEAELSWVDSHMRAADLPPDLADSGRFGVKPRNALSLASYRVGGRVRDSRFDGDLELGADGSDRLQSTTRLREGGQKLQSMQRLHLNGNSLRSVVSRFDPSAENAPAYEVLIVTDNVFAYPESSFLSQEITLNGNQFLGAMGQQGTAVLVGKTGAVLGNQAQDPDAVLFWSIDRRTEAANLLSFQDMNTE